MRHGILKCPPAIDPQIAKPWGRVAGLRRRIRVGSSGLSAYEVFLFGTISGIPAVNREPGGLGWGTHLVGGAGVVIGGDQDAVGVEAYVVHDLRWVRPRGV